MQYMLLLYAAQDGRPAPESPEAMQALMEPWVKYTADLKEAGVFLAGDALKPTTTATSVRTRDGQTTTTDGPFAETREALGGYYLLDCPDLDEARKWAAACPLANYGTVEIRPVETFG
jgi:hypothetical protein